MELFFRVSDHLGAYVFATISDGFAAKRACFVWVVIYAKHEKFAVATTNKKVKFEMVFEIKETKKLGGGWKQQFVAIRNKLVYLRIVGDGKVYRIMTATATEDLGGYHICPDKERLWAAALQLSKNYDCAGNFSDDRKGREYIQIFNMSQEQDETDDDFSKDFYEIIDEFFNIYDNLNEKN